MKNFMNESLRLGVLFTLILITIEVVLVAFPERGMVSLSATDWVLTVAAFMLAGLAVGVLITGMRRLHRLSYR
ncbi:MAG: hypothetical protein Q8R25_03370 [bacterium]|nr:hypothetical protein [bacterium]